MSAADALRSCRAALARSILRLDEPRFERHTLTLILVVAALIRILAALLIPSHELYLEDSDSYLAAARDLLSGHPIRSILVMPGYPALLALVGATPVIRLCVDILLAVATVWIVARLAQAVSGDRIAGLFAGLIWALYPFAIFYALVGYSETLFVALTLTGFLCYYRAAFTLGSLAMVAAILTRPLVEMLTPILILTFALVIHRQTLGRALRHLAVFGAIYLILMTPWWLHNYAKYGSFVRLNLAFGAVLYTGNNPMNQTGGVQAGVDFDLTPFRHITDPVAWDRALRDAAVRFIVQSPRRFFELTEWKLLRLWGPSSGARFVALSLISFVPVAALAIIGFVHLAVQRWRCLVPIVLFLGYTTAVHMVTIATLRYRFPMEPFLVVLAGTALACGLRLLPRGNAPAAAPATS